MTDPQRQAAVAQKISINARQAQTLFKIWNKVSETNFLVENLKMFGGKSQTSILMKNC